jgi:hypothetical protein
MCGRVERSSMCAATNAGCPWSRMPRRSFMFPFVNDYAVGACGCRQAGRLAVPHIEALKSVVAAARLVLIGSN